jgi:hypothetical protein
MTPASTPAYERAAAQVDPRPKQLLERYASLIGSMLMEVGENLVQFEPPTAEWRHWEGQRVVTLGLTPDALEEDPEAELLGVGTPAFERLLGAIRTRGSREDRGLLPPAHDPTAQLLDPPVPIDGGGLGVARGDLTLIPVGMLVARVSIKAGPALQELLVESPVVDLSTGSKADKELSPFLTGSDGLIRPSVAPATVAIVQRRPMESLLPLVFGYLEDDLRDRLASMAQQAQVTCRDEVARLERYYSAVLKEIEDEGRSEDAAGKKRDYQRDLERRRTEEEERFRVRVLVHPIQLIEWQVLAQRVRWQVEGSISQQDASLSATRLLTGNTVWRVHCPTCGAPPERIRVCADGHLGCVACTGQCTICSAFVREGHGLAECTSRQHAVCGAHALVCLACGKGHCVNHAAHCAAGDHQICPACAVACARCGIGLCKPHAMETPSTAPQGPRWLCENCVVYCEGGPNEPVGLDEVVRCTSCDRHICLVHQVQCVVDGSPHCSRHLRKSDRTGRLACEAHRASCEDEPGSVFASDEIVACASCARKVCETHGGPCAIDGARHCSSHLAVLADQPKQRACEKHRSICHIDGVTFSLTGTKACPVCGKLSCDSHRKVCSWCARQACIQDLDEGKCHTCTRLEEVSDLSDDLIPAALLANSGEPPRAKRLRVARDVGGTVVELELGWTRRRLVFTVPHGETRPRTVMEHGLFGAKRRR